MEIAFLRESWNLHLKEDIFMQELKNKYNIDQVKSIFKWIVEFNGEIRDGTLYLYEYAKSILNEYTISVLDIIDEENYIHTIGCGLIFSRYGDIIFNHLSIGSKESSLCIIKAFRICFNIPDNKLLNQSYLLLSRSHIIGAILASSRVFCYDEFIKLRNLYTLKKSLLTINEEQISKDFILYPLLADNLRNPMTYVDLQDTVMILHFSLHIWIMRLGIFDYYQPYLTTQFYFHLFSDFVSCPSLLSAFILTNLFVDVYEGSIHKSFYRDPSRTTVFNREALEMALKGIYEQYSQILNNDNPSYEDSDCFDFFMGGLSLEEAKSFLCTLPSVVDESKLLELGIQYPAFSSHIIPYVLEKMNSDSISSAVNIANQILRRLGDFRFLAAQQGMLMQCFASFINLAMVTFDDYSFETIWTLALSFVRFSWRSGSPSLRSVVIRFVEKQNGSIAFFLKSLLNLELPIGNRSISIYDINREQLPIEKCVLFLMFLFQIKQEDIPSVVELLHENSYLWPSALIWGIRSNNPLARNLTQLKFPDEELHNFLFYHMMIGLKQSAEPWKAVVEHPDYDSMVRFCPESIECIHSRLINDICAISKLHSVIPKLTWTIMITWRAWANKFGMKVFVTTLVKLLMWVSKNSSDTEMNEHLFQYSSYFVVISSDQVSSVLEEALEGVLCIVKNREIEMINPEGVSVFTIMLLVAISEKNSSQYNDTIGLARQFLNENVFPNDPRTIFALSIIKKSFYIPRLRDFLTMDIFELFVSYNDWQSVIDFFISKSIRIVNTNNSVIPPF